MQSPMRCCWHRWMGVGFWVVVAFCVDKTRSSSLLHENNHEPTGKINRNKRRSRRRTNQRYRNHAFFDTVRSWHSTSQTRSGTVHLIQDQDQHQNQNHDDTSNHASMHPPAGQAWAMCHLTALWSFTYLDTTPTTTTTTTKPKSLGPGYYGDAASALLAAHHFNHGIDTIVPQLHNLPQQCNIRLTIDFLDSFRSRNKSVHQMETRLRHQEEGTTCAVLGGYSSSVSEAVGVLTGVHGLPQMSPKSTSPALDNTELYPLFSRTVPSDTATALLILNLLLHTWKIHHLAVVSVNDAFGRGYQQAMKSLAEDTPGFFVKTTSFPSGGGSEKEMEGVMKEVKEWGYNYFLCIVSTKEEYEAVMTEAYKQGIAGPQSSIKGGGGRDTTWLIADRDRMLRTMQYPKGSVMELASRGVGVVQAGAVESMEGYQRFLEVWEGLGGSDVDYFNSKQPEGEVYYKASSTYFKTHKPTAATLFAYDAVIALGLAACRATSSSNHTHSNSNSNNTTNNINVPYLDGIRHYNHLRNLHFDGASGPVQFDPQTMSRQSTSASYLLYNVWPQENHHHHHQPNPNHNNVSNHDERMVSFAVEPTAMYMPTKQTMDISTAEWQTIPFQPFRFAKNATVPPPPLAPYPQTTEYIGRPLRILGLTLSSSVMSLSLAFALWTYQTRQNRIVRASQPLFLILICAGTFIMGLAIVPRSLDDEVLSLEGASRSCMAVPWLYSVGYVLAFSALFSKTWRINKIFFNKTVKRLIVKPTDVLAPLVILLSMNLITLLTWTLLSPMTYVRSSGPVLDELGRPTSSRGSCVVGRESIPYLAVLVGINVSTLVFACVQCYRARYISTEFSESRYVGMAIASMLQASFIGIPLMIIVWHQPKPSYFVTTCLIYITSMSVLLLVFIPKRRIVKEKRRLAKSKNQPRKKSKVPNKFVRNRPCDKHGGAGAGAGGVGSGEDGRIGDEEQTLGVTPTNTMEDMLQQQQEMVPLPVGGGAHGESNNGAAASSSVEKGEEEKDVPAAVTATTAAVLEDGESAAIGTGIRVALGEEGDKNGDGDKHDESRSIISHCSTDEESEDGIQVEWNPLVEENKRLRKELKQHQTEKAALLKKISRFHLAVPERRQSSVSEAAGVARQMALQVASSATSMSSGNDSNKSSPAPANGGEPMVLVRVPVKDWVELTNDGYRSEKTHKTRRLTKGPSVIFKSFMGRRRGNTENVLSEAAGDELVGMNRGLTKGPSTMFKSFLGRKRGNNSMVVSDTTDEDCLENNRLYLTKGPSMMFKSYRSNSAVLQEEPSDASSEN